MFVAIIFILIIIGSVWFHIWSPWWWTPVASNWGNIDSTIELTFWITGSVFVAVCSFMLMFLVVRFSDLLVRFVCHVVCQCRGSGFPDRC